MVSKKKRIRAWLSGMSASLAICEQVAVYYLIWCDVMPTPLCAREVSLRPTDGDEQFVREGGWVLEVTLLQRAPLRES